MDIIFLNQKKSTEALVLRPKKDTVYVLPRQSAPARLDLHLKKPGVRAFILGLFEVKNAKHIVINQTHQAPNTESHVLLKAVLKQKGNFLYHGNLHIEARALNALASQEARGLLLGEESIFQAIPALEILPAQVVCQHKASATPVNKGSLFVLQARGISEPEAEALLEKAFLESAFEALAGWRLSDQEQEQIRQNFGQTL